MPQKEKIFDVIPPKESEKNKPSQKKAVGSRISLKKAPLFVIGSIIVVFFLSWLLIEPKANVKIWPQKEPMELQIQATVYDQISVAIGDMPGTVLEVEKIVSDKFESTGSKLKTARASGIITVYNTYSTNVQPLIANTRFMSDDGKLFRSQERITIPGAYYQGGKLMPGTVEVEVVADQPGGEYNIGPSTFSLPGLVGTALYTSIYGKSSESMRGGVKEEVPQITREDIERAEFELTQLVLEESKAALEKILPSGDHIVLKDAIEQKILEYLPLAEAGQERADFTAQISSQAKAMVFKKEAVREFAISYAVNLVPEGWVLQENSLQVKYTVEEIDLAKNQIILNLEITAAVYQTFDEENLKEVLSDKTPEVISRILGDYPQVSQAKVDLWPFWTENSPKNPERINIEMVLD